MKNDSTPILIPYTPDEFWQRMRDLIRHEIRQGDVDKPVVQYEVKGLVKKPLYTSKEVEAMFNVSRQTIHSWCKDGLLKPYKVKSRVYFLATDLEQLMGKREVLTQP